MSRRRPRPRSIGQVAGMDVVAVDTPAGVLVAIVPVLVDEHPPELKEAIVRRRALVIDGECACGATFDAERAVAAASAGRYGVPPPALLELEHEAGCPAPDARRLLDQWTRSRRGDA